MSENLDWLKRFQDIYKPLLGDDYDKFEEGLRAEKSRHIRLNLSRNINYLQELSPFKPLQSPDLAGVYKITADAARVTDSISFQTGGAYIMNPSSVIPPMILSSLMPEYPVILDVSAAPGGKTCALSDMMKRKGLIIANEISSARLKSLHFNLEKYGCYNVKTISTDGRLLHKTFNGAFDGILLDAPCSNENKIFRNKTVRQNWNKNLVERMASLQKPLILSAFDCLKEGGILVYSTCTMSIEENEQIAQHLLKERSSATLLQIDGWSGGGFSGADFIDEKVIRISPDMDTLDGFFIAVFCKKGLLEERNIPKSKISSMQSRFFQDNFQNIPEGINIIEADGRGYLEPSLNPFGKTHFSRRGLNVYRLTKNGMEPSCCAVWEFASKLKAKDVTEIDENTAVTYLKGFDIAKPHQYNSGILFSNGLPVGYGKLIGQDIKNKLDRYFLFGKNIEW